MSVCALLYFVERFVSISEQNLTTLDNSIKFVQNKKYRYQICANNKSMECPYLER